HHHCRQNGRAGGRGRSRASDPRCRRGSANQSRASGAGRLYSFEKRSLPLTTSPTNDGVFRLDGRVAVVTGGASGIGRAIAEMFAAHGARMHIVDLNEQAAESVKEGIHYRGGSAKIHGCDVSDRQSVERVF